MIGSSMERGARLLAGGALVAALASCGGGGEGGDSAATGGWKMVLAHRGGSVVVPLEAMNVYLVEDEFYPEYFSIEGTGAILGGHFPEGLHVGYDEQWNLLFGKSIVIGTSGGDPTLQPQECFVELSPGVRSRVMGGTVIFEKLTGKLDGSEGDKTLSGRIMLVVQTSAGTETVMGTISVHCITWG
jgi:hypothetical protein